MAIFGLNPKWGLALDPYMGLQSASASDFPALDEKYKSVRKGIHGHRTSYNKYVVIIYWRALMNPNTWCDGFRSTLPGPSEASFKNITRQHYRLDYLTPLPLIFPRLRG